MQNSKNYCIFASRSIIGRLSKMKASTRDRLYRLDRTVGKIINVGTVLFFVLLIAAAFNTPWKQVLKYLFFGVGAVWILLIICRHCLSPFVKSEEEEEFEEKVEYVLKNKYPEALRAAQDYSPLCNLTPEQEERVKKLLRDLPSNPNKLDYVYMSYIANYLTALKELGKANLNNVYALQQWIEQVTGKRTPDFGHFNEALTSTTDSKVAKAREKLEHLLK